MSAQEITQKIKREIIALWFSRCYLKRIAKRYPEFFLQMLDDELDSDKGRKIMVARYVDRVKFKQIPDLVNLEERQVYKIHQNIIYHLIGM